MALALYAHATGLCKEVWQPVVRLVQVPGLSAHLFDFKGHGARGLREPVTPDDGPWDEWAVDDVLAAVDRAQRAHQQKRPLPVIGVGHSFGGAALVKVTLHMGVAVVSYYSSSWRLLLSHPRTRWLQRWP